MPADVFPSEGRTVHPETHQLITFGIRKNCLSNGRNKLLIYQFIEGEIKADHSYQLHTKFYLIFFCEN